MTGGIRVLHVDDDAEFVRVAAACLEREDDGLTVETATSAAEGLDVLAREDVDAVVSDYEMPGRDGIAFLEAVRETHADLPFFLFTGAGDETVASDAIDAGATDYLQKRGGLDQYALLANRIRNAVKTRHARRAAGASEQRLQRVYERISDGTFALDEDWRYVAVDEASAHLVGRTRDELLGSTIWECFPDIAGTPIEDALRDAMAGDETTTVEEYYPPLDGWFDVTVSPTDAGVAVNVRDVSERKRREAALTELHAFATEITAYDTIDEVCRRTVEAAESVLNFDRCVVSLEEDGMLPITALSSGVTPTDATAMSVNEGITGLTYRTGKSVLVEDTRTHPEANPKGPYRSAISVPIGDHGVFQTVSADVGAFDDADLELAELLIAHAETALDRIEREHEFEQYETIVRTIPEGVFVLDADGVIVRGNAASSEMLGYDPGELVGVPFQDLVERGIVEDAVVDTYLDLVREMLSDSNERDHGHFEYVAHVDGEERVFETHVALRPPDGDFNGTIGIFRDVTEQRRRQRELARQNERLDDFASVVSHDLRNPLNVAEGHLQLARDERDSDDLRAVARAHSRIEELVDDLLTLAREGDAVTDAEPVPLADTARECWRTVNTADATLDVTTDAVVVADCSRLQQLLENLFRNAVEHAGAGVTLTVGDIDDGPSPSAEPARPRPSPSAEPARPRPSPSAEPARTGFFVADDGPGIPPADREHVFDAGYSTSADGTGFGLNIVREIADAHDWTVTVTEAAGGGARFELTDVEFAD